MEGREEEGRAEGRKRGRLGREAREGGKEGMREGGEEGRREGGKEGRREGGKEGRREGGKEGRREGGKEGRREGGKEGSKERGRGREGGNIDFSMVHDVTMIYDIAYTLYDIIYCNFSITLIRLAIKFTKQSKVFKNGHYNQSTMSKIQTIHII